MKCFICGCKLNKERERQKLCTKCDATTEFDNGMKINKGFNFKPLLFAAGIAGLSMIGGSK